ncbi:MAG: NUDIX hydrolase [Dethiobacteraceae bacterium]
MEKTISTKFIYKGKVINVRVDDVELKNGTLSKREVVEHPGAAAVLAVARDGNVLFVRQFRKAVEKELLEIPAGKLDPGETPAACVTRELAEETGMAAGNLRKIASFYSSPGFASEKLHIFLATELYPGEVAKPVADELLQVQKIPFQEALTMARNGVIEDGKTLVALLLAGDLPDLAI